MYGLIHSGGEGLNGQRTTLVRIDARPSEGPWHVMRVKDDGTNRCKRGLKVARDEVVWTFEGDALPTKAMRRRAAELVRSGFGPPFFGPKGAA